jgi:quercetin dioxygenase-like cupin family protein
MHISHGRSGQPSEQRTATFTGTVHMDPVLTAPEVMINTVVFTPGARTHWHRHPGGQLLVVTAGRGVVATRDQGQVITGGDVIWAEGTGTVPPGSFLLHLAVSVGSADWLDPVSDADYASAVQ